jgi:hypothetical protein
MGDEIGEDGPEKVAFVWTIGRRCAIMTVSIEQKDVQAK